MKYRAKDIARELGVSPATVSLVINNRPGVGEEKRKEIAKRIKELGCEYLLKENNQNKGDIGFVIYKCGGQVINEYPFFNYLSETIIGEIEKNNYSTKMMYLDKRASANDNYQLLEEHRHAGYIVYAVEIYPEDMEFFEKLHVPCVFLDNPMTTMDVNAVTVDNQLGIFRGFEYLYRMGHRRIGYIKSRFDILCFDERFRTYCDCMKCKGLEIKDDYVMRVGYMESETERDVEEYLDNCQELPTAFLADNDLLACRAVQRFKKKGIQVPEEVSFVGFDNRPICSFIEPKLTTICLPGDAMGTLAVKVLVDRIENDKNLKVKYKVSPQLLENESVRKID